MSIPVIVGSPVMLRFDNLACSRNDFPLFLYIETTGTDQARSNGLLVAIDGRVLYCIVVPLLLDSGSRLTASESQHQVQHGTRLDLVRLCSLLVVPVYSSSAFVARF